MSQESQTQSVSLTLADQARAIDRISTSAMEAFASAESFEKELTVAQAMIDLREHLTPEVMRPIMGLMNTSLGFRTDHDPAQIDGKTNKPFEPYAVEVVRECFIEARLRGFHAVGNEFNIISGRFYACVAGFDRKVRTHPRVTDFRENFDVPRLVGEKGALVKCRADWKQDNVPQSLEREFPVRVNANMGADAIMGKCKRKLFAAVYARLTGTVTPEGEIGDEPVIPITATSTPVDAADVFKGKAATNQQTITTTPAPPEATSDVVDLPHPTPQQELYRIIDKAGHSFDVFIKWAARAGALTKEECEKIKAFADMPEPMAKRFVKSKAGLLTRLEAEKGETK